MANLHASDTTATADEDVNGHLQLGMDELDKAQRDYMRAEEYYDGRRPEYFASIRLRRAMARTGSSFKFNFARTPVSAVADRLEIASITATNPNASTAIEDMWRDNQLDLYGPDITLRACEYGDAYVIVWPSDADEDDIAGVDDPDDQGVAGQSKDLVGEAITTGGDDDSTIPVDTDGDGLINVDIFYNSPTSVRLFYDPEKPLKKLFAVKKWILTATKQVRVDLYYPNRIERYISKPGKTDAKAKDLGCFTADGQGDENGVLENPFGQIPVFHFRTDRPYGAPEHHEFYGPQDAIRKLIVSHMSGVDYQSFPQRYALMEADADTGEATNGDEDAFSFALDTGATSRPADPQSQLSADAGSFWQLKGYKEVGQFAEADPDTFLKPIEKYLRFGAQITNTPLRLFDYAAQLPSGAAQTQAEGPFVKKVCARMLSFGATWREVFEFALKIAGFPQTDVDVRWKPPFTVDDLQGWQTVGEKIKNGMPPAQAFKEAGYTQEQVDEWFGDGDDDLPYRVDLLVKIAQALQGFSAAANLGTVINDSQVRDILAALLAEPEFTDPDDETSEPQDAPVKRQGVSQ